MFTLNRYLGSAVAGASIAGILIFVFILITGNAMREIIGLLAEGYLPLPLFLRLIALLIPFTVAFAMPLGVLIAILLIMGRMSANQELTALKAAGISLYTISAPLLLVALIGSCVAVYIHAVHAPQARSTYKNILSDIVRTDPLRFIVPRVFIHEFPGYVLYVGRKEERTLRDFWLWELDSRRRAVRLLRAEEGEFTYDAEGDALILVLRGGFTELRDPADPDNLREVRPTLSFSDARIRLPFAQVLGRPREVNPYTNTPIAALLAMRRAAKAEAAAATDPELRAAAQLHGARALYHASRRIAMAFSVFSLAVFAIPLGLRVGRSETYANFVLALIVAMTYYLAFIFIGWAERSPHLRPDLLIWLPNLAAQLLGFTLLQRANQH